MRLFPISLVSALALTSFGCQVLDYQPPPPVETTDILAMTEAGTPAELIITKIRESRTVYRMDSEDVIELHQKGVAKEVIDFMLKTERLERERHHPYPAYYPYGANWGYAPWYSFHYHGHGYPSRWCY